VVPSRARSSAWSPEEWSHRGRTSRWARTARCPAEFDMSSRRWVNPCPLACRNPWKNPPVPIKIANASMRHVVVLLWPILAMCSTS
jgi:hypothetical protein